MERIEQGLRLLVVSGDSGRGAVKRGRRTKMGNHEQFISDEELKRIRKEKLKELVDSKGGKSKKWQTELYMCLMQTSMIS
jgi:hypothetical protein